MPRPPNPFVKRKNFYITYHKLQENFAERGECLTILKRYFAEFEPQPYSYTIGVEDYPSEESEGFHAHCLLEYLASTSIHRDKLTWLSHVPFFKNVSHGSASVTRTRDYCLKGDCTFSNWIPRESDSDSGYADVINAATRASADELLRLRYPQRYIFNYSNVQSFLNGHFTGRNVPYALPDGYSTPTIPDSDAGSIINGWMDENFHKVSSLFFLFNGCY